MLVIYSERYAYRQNNDSSPLFMLLYTLLVIAYSLFFNRWVAFLASYRAIAALPISKITLFASLLIYPVMLILPIVFIAVLWLKSPLYLFLLTASIAWTIIALYMNRGQIASMAVLFALSTIASHWFSAQTVNPTQYHYILQHGLEYIVIAPMTIASILSIRDLVYKSSAPYQTKSQIGFGL